MLVGFATVECSDYPRNPTDLFKGSSLLHLLYKHEKQKPQINKNHPIDLSYLFFSNWIFLLTNVFGWTSIFPAKQFYKFLDFFSINHETPQRLQSFFHPQFHLTGLMPGQVVDLSESLKKVQSLPGPGAPPDST